MNVLKLQSIMKKTRKVVAILMMAVLILSTIIEFAFAGEEEAHVDNLRKRIIDTTRNIAFPIGGALIFLSVVMIAIKIIVSHYNPNARGQALEGLQWVAVGSIILGSAILIANILISMGGGEMEGIE